MGAGFVSAYLRWVGGNVGGTGAATPLYYYLGSDILPGEWTASSGDDLYAMLDEETADDDTYIQSAENPTGDPCELGFIGIPSVVGDGTKTLSYRIRAHAACDLSVYLLGGDGTEIAHWTYSPGPATWTQYDQDLSSEQITAWAAAGYTGSRFKLVAQESADYFVSPDGDDDNPGTEAEPWATFYHAAATAVAGDTVVFEDGTYTETQQVVIAHSGTADARITFRARNPRAAVISFDGVTTWGRLYTRQSYVTVQDFEITQVSKESSGAADVLVYFDSSTGTLGGAASTGNRFIGNDVHYTYFNCVKNYKSDDFLCSGNELHDSSGMAFASSNTFGTVFRDNYVYDVTGAVAASSVACEFKCGARSAQVYDNVVRVKTGKTLVTAISIGGSSSVNAVYDASGYECYNSVAYNNVLVSEDIGSMTTGFLLSGAKDCALYNNIVIGAVWAIYLQCAHGDITNGWTWEPTTDDPAVKNNMILNNQGTGSHTSFYLGTAGEIGGTVDHDYNLFYNAAGNNTLPPSETHGVYTNPLLVATLTDWHLQAGSPAEDAGEAQSDFVGFNSEAIDVSQNVDGDVRSSPWNIGIY